VKDQPDRPRGAKQKKWNQIGHVGKDTTGERMNSAITEDDP